MTTAPANVVEHERVFALPWAAEFARWPTPAAPPVDARAPRRPVGVATLVETVERIVAGERKP